MATTKSVQNILNALKENGRPAIIPDASRDDLPPFFATMGYKVGAEIGVYKGAFTKKLLDAGLRVYGVDPWRVYGSYLGPDPQNVDRNYRDAKEIKIEKYQKRQDFLYGHTQRYLREHLDTGLCTLIRSTSMEAVDKFKDESIDFVYIDGHHGFRYVAEDLVEWAKKVKKGGVVSGHDYALNKKPPNDPDVLQVKYVLHAYIDAFNVPNFYVLGRTRPPGERTLGKNRGSYYDIYTHNGKQEKRDRWRSWFWVKE